MANMTMASERAVDTLLAVDPGFQQLVKLVLGPDADADEVWEGVFGKMSPTASDTHARSGNLERRVAQGSVVLGGTAGSAALIQAARDPHLKDTRVGRGADRAAAKLVPTGGVLRRKGAAAVKWIGPKRLAGAALGLQATELAGTAVIGHHLKEPVHKGPTQLGLFPKSSGWTKNAASKAKGALRPTQRPMVTEPGPHVVKPGPPVSRDGVRARRQAGASQARPSAQASAEAKHFARSGKPYVANHSEPGQVTSAAAGLAAQAIATPRRQAATAGIIGTTAYVAGKRRGSGGYDSYAKRDAEIVWEGEFSKVDTDKRLAFGWASVVSKNGLPVIDKQDDVMDIEEIEKAAYAYVERSRVGGDMHRRTPQDTPHHVADMVESFVVTPEKISKMGLPADTPTGWWVGFKIHDEPTWQMVKKGERTGFSIHGRGRRVPAGIDDVMAYS